MANVITPEEIVGIAFLVIAILGIATAMAFVIYSLIE
jgi:preprotein translocase subunit Sec61beta